MDLDGLSIFHSTLFSFFFFYDGHRIEKHKTVRKHFPPLPIKRKHQFREDYIFINPPTVLKLIFFLFCYFSGNGYITTAVLREILKELDDKITNEDLDLMIEEIDADGSGTVDFDGK